MASDGCAVSSVPCECHVQMIVGPVLPTTSTIDRCCRTPVGVLPSAVGLLEQNSFTLQQRGQTDSNCVCVRSRGSPTCHFLLTDGPLGTADSPPGCYFISSPCSVYVAVISKNITILHGGEGMCREKTRGKGSIELKIKQTQEL